MKLQNLQKTKKNQELLIHIKKRLKKAEQAYRNCFEEAGEYGHNIRDISSGKYAIILPSSTRVNKSPFPPKYYFYIFYTQSQILTVQFQNSFSLILYNFPYLQYFGLFCIKYLLAYLPSIRSFCIKYLLAYLYLLTIRSFCVKYLLAYLPSIRSF